MMFQAVPLAPVDTPLQIGALIIGLAIAIIFHEVAHGAVAFRLGDPTAYFAGRLTLNPIKHIDLWGTILLPLLLLVTTNFRFTFGWAKPVPVNYHNLRYGRWGPVIVALAGPATNLVILLVTALAARISPPETALPFFFIAVARINGVLMLFNLLPIPPLDGSKILYLFLDNRPDVIQFLERYGLFILLAVLFFGGPFLTVLVFEPAVTLTELVSGYALR